MPFRVLYLITDNILFGYVEDGLVSLAVPGTFLFFLFFGRIYALTGAFIVMIFEMITGDIATFGVIYVIVVTAFGQGKLESTRTTIRFFSLVFYLLFRDTTEGGYCEPFAPNDTCGVDNMCSFKNFEAWMTMVHFTMGEFDVKLRSSSIRFHFHLVLVLSVRSNALRLSSEESLHCLHDSHPHSPTEHVNRFDGQHLSTCHCYQRERTDPTGT